MLVKAGGPGWMGDSPWQGHPETQVPSILLLGHPLGDACTFIGEVSLLLPALRKGEKEAGGQADSFMMGSGSHTYHLCSHLIGLSSCKERLGK